MNKLSFLGSTALVALVSGNAALADVTPEEVWQNWKDMSASYGQTITTASEERDGDALVVSGLTVGSEQEGAKVAVTVEEVRFTDLGDGTVEVTLSDSYPMTISMPAEEEGPEEVVITISHPGMSLLASGSAEETRYDFTAPELSVELTEMKGAATADADVKMSFKLTEAAGNYIVTGAADKKALSSNVSAAAMDIVASGSSTEGDAPGSFALNAKIADLTGTSTGTLAGEMTDMAAAIKAGFSSDADFTYGAGSYDIAVTDPTGDMKIIGSTEGGSLSFTMGAGGLGYGGTGKNVSLTASGAQIPFPELKVSYAESAFNFLMPVVAGDAPSDFALLTKLVDVTISEEIWATFDPTAQLPRDPMTVMLDAKGTAKLFVDIMDPKAMEAMGEAAPGELHSLDLTSLQIKMAGAELTGDGALTFDNSDLVTFGGMPAPTGAVNLKAVGVNGLMDKLVAMGLLPEDQVMSARMMMGMFAKVVEGEEDTMTSTLEFKDKGFFANGMQLQ